MDIVLIVLNYNDFKTTISFINRIKEYTILDKIIIVDNKSTDDSYRYLQYLESHKIDIIKNDNNYGYGKGNNLGILYALEQYSPANIIIANPDVEFDENLIKELKLTIELDDKVALTSGMVIENGKSAISGWKLPDFKGELLSNFIILNKLISVKMLNNIIDFKGKNIEVDVLPGCLFMMNTKILNEIGYFNNDTFLYYEENILCHNIKSNGFKVILNTNVCYKHEHGKSINKSIKNKILKYKILQQSKLIYLNKCLGVKGIKLSFYKILSKVGIFERSIIYKVFRH